MFSITCSGCQRENVPLKDCVMVDGRLTCLGCFNKEHPTETERAGKSIARLEDMQTCAFCGKRSPEITIKDMDGSPVCISCSQDLISKPFPLWVKAFFAGVLLLVAFSFAWNWRFFEGFHAVKGMKAAIEDGELDRVVPLSDAAHASVPEDQELAAASNYFNGLKLLQEDSQRAALARFEKVALYSTDLYDLTDVVAQARIGIAFDEKDYDTYLSLAREVATRKPMEPMVIGSLSSAFACKFAVSGDSAYYDSSWVLLNKALSLSPEDTSVLEYTQRLRHRLATRDVIDRATYMQRFPEGWKP